jgi:hypothetical protein
VLILYKRETRLLIYDRSYDLLQILFCVGRTLRIIGGVTTGATTPAPLTVSEAQPLEQGNSTVRQPTVENHRKTNTENILPRGTRFTILHSKSLATENYGGNLFLYRYVYTTVLFSYFSVTTTWRRSNEP